MSHQQIREFALSLGVSVTEYNGLIKKLPTESRMALLRLVETLLGRRANGSVPHFQKRTQTNGFLLPGEVLPGPDFSRPAQESFKVFEGDQRAEATAAALVGDNPEPLFLAQEMVRQVRGLGSQVALKLADQVRDLNAQIQAAADAPPPPVLVYDFTFLAAMLRLVREDLEIIEFSPERGPARLVVGSAFEWIERNPDFNLPVITRDGLITNLAPYAATMRLVPAIIEAAQRMPREQPEWKGSTILGMRPVQPTVDQPATATSAPTPVLVG